MVAGVDERYNQYGYSSQKFAKTRYQYFDRAGLVKAVNSNHFDKITEDMIRELILQLNSHPKRKLRNGKIGLPVKSVMMKGGGRYICKVDGHKGKSVIGWTPDKMPILDNAKGACCMTFGPMPSVIRAVVASDMIDFDIANCHPEVTAALFSRHGIEHPILDDFTANREKWYEVIMTQCNVSRNAAKQLMLCMHNDGNVPHWCRKNSVDMCDMPSSVVEYKNEILAGRNVLLKLPEYANVIHFVKVDKKNPERSAFSIILQDWERRLMEMFVLCAEHSGHTVDAHIYDGFMTLLDEDVHEVLQHQIPKWCSSIHAAVGIRVDLKYKPWIEYDVSIFDDVSEEFDSYPDDVEQDEDIICPGDIKPSRLLFEPLKSAGVLDNIVCVDMDQNNFYVCNTNSLWSLCGLNTVQNTIIERLATCGRGCNERLMVASFVTKTIKGCRGAMFDKLFPDKLDKFPPGFVPFDNGIYNANTDVLSEGFRPEDYVTKTMGYDWAPTEEGLLFWEEVYARLLPHDQRRITMIMFYARAMFGNAAQKFFLIVVDMAREFLEGNSGKSWFVDAIILVFGNFINGRQTDIWVVNKNANPNAHKANELADRDSKIRIQDEIGEHDRLDGNKIRQDACGATKTKTSARGCSAAEMTAYTKRYSNALVGNAKEVGNALQAMDINSQDGTLERLLVINFESRFLKPSRLAEAQEQGVQNVFPQDATVMDKYEEHKASHAAFLAKWYREYPGDDKFERPQICTDDLKFLLKPDDDCTAAIADLINRWVERCDPPPTGVLTRNQFDTPLHVPKLVEKIREDIAKNKAKIVTARQLKGKQFEQRVLDGLKDKFGDVVVEDTFRRSVWEDVEQSKSKQQRHRSVVLNLRVSANSPWGTGSMCLLVADDESE